MRYHTKHEAQKIYDELYECRDCGTQHESYNQLYHPDEHTGGFCRSCKSEIIDVMTLQTVYQEIWVRDTDDAVEVALDVGDWQVAKQIIKIGEPIDAKLA